MPAAVTITVFTPGTLSPADTQPDFSFTCHAGCKLSCDQHVTQVMGEVTLEPVSPMHVQELASI